MMEGMLEVWLSDHGDLTYLPEPGFGIGLLACILFFYLFMRRPQ